MDVYLFHAAFLCDDCGETVIKEQMHNIEDTGDSDDYPQGPYPDGGGEADSPHHCDHCGEFLENPLTTDGIEYVKDSIKSAPSNAASVIWANYYDYIE
jgi:hypothetical protein